MAKLNGLLAVVGASILMMAVGCAENNPLAVREVGSGDDGGISIVALAKTTAVGDTSTDSIGRGTTAMCSAEIARKSLADSILSSRWDFGDGSSYNCSNDSGICSVEHQYNTLGVYTISLVVVLKGNKILTPWRRIVVVETSNLTPVTSNQDSMLMYGSSSQIGNTGHWDVNFLVGVNSISAAAVRANISVLRLFREGGRDNEWSQKIAIVSKTSDGKFYLFTIQDLVPGRDYRFRFGMDINDPSNTILNSTEFIRNKFYSVEYDVFEFSLNYNGQAVPKTKDYGTVVTPVDTSDTTKVTPEDTTKPTLIGQFGDTSQTDWIIRKEYVVARSSYIFYFNYRPSKDPIGQVAQAAFVVANMHPTVNSGKESLTMMGDTVGYIEIPVDEFPDEGLRFYQYGRGTAYRNFSGSLCAMTDGSVWLTANIATLSKKAVR